MQLNTCTKCGATVPETASDCPKCGNLVEQPPSGNEPAIRGFGGKLQAIGTLTLAGGIVATVAGAWWGPALVLPGVVLLMLGKF